MTRASAGGRWRWWAWAGAILLAGGVVCLARDVERWNAVWYVPAWYGYLLILDAVIHRVAGRSPLSGSPRGVIGWMLWSVPFWFLSEAYNLRLQNWYYVFALRSPAAAALFGVAAFATVIPACFLHAEALRALGAWRDGRCRPRAVTPAAERAVLLLGLASIAAPLLWPRHAFALVWGATLWIPEVVNRRAGRPSLLADAEEGRCGRLLRLLAGGLWAGAVWEGFNFFARCKWIYTVPGFEDWKLFEMPLAGFGGFPVLALAAFGFHSLVAPLSSPSALRSSRGRVRLVAAAAAAAAFTAMTHRAVLDRTVASRRPLLSELRGLAPDDASRLRDRGVPTPERLHRTASDEGLSRLSGQTGIPAERLAPAVRHAALALHKGMGAPAAALLEAAGIRGVPDLAGASPEALAGRLHPLALRAGVRPPRAAEVKVWVRAARVSGQPRR